MPTGQQIINDALTTLGILEQGGIPSVSDSVDALAELNTMWEAWGIDEGLIYALVHRRFPVTANIGMYTLGPGAILNAPLPARIYEAIFSLAYLGAIATTSLGDGGSGYAVNDTGVILDSGGIRATYTVNTVDANGAVLTFTVASAGTGYIPGYGYSTQTGGGQPGVGTGFTLNVLTVTSVGGQNRNPLKIVEAASYYAHKDLTATAYTPDEIYVDFNPDMDGFMRVYPWPIPTAAGCMLELLCGVNFANWSLTAIYNLSRGLAEAVGHSLAWHLIPRYGSLVSKETMDLVGQLAQKSETRIREANARNRQLALSVMDPQPPQQPGPAQPVSE